MITVGTMRLPQPEPLDDLAAFLRGLEPDGGYWATMRRLADHDHSGGLMGVPVSGGGAAAEVTITGTEGVTVVEAPDNVFALGLTASPDAANTIEIRANGIYSAAGAIPPEYVTDAELAAALGPYALDTDLANHAAAADPHPTYLTAAEGSALFRPISYVTDVTVTGDNGVGVTESPANTFALATRVSPDAGNALALRANGLYSTDTTGAGGAFVDEAGDTMTGLLSLQGASSTANVVQHKLAADAQPRFRIDADGKLQWGGGVGVPNLSLQRVSANDLTVTCTFFYPTADGSANLGQTGNRWNGAYVRDLHVYDAAGTVRIGQTGVSTAGAIRLRNDAPGLLAWRNAGNTANLTLGVDASDRLAYSGAAFQVGTTPAAAGALRLPNNQALSWRNAGNTADLPLVANASNVLTFNGLVVVTQAALDALTTRVTALETSVAALKTHVHELGTFGAGTLAPSGGIP